MYKYEIIIYWSDEDGLYIAEAPSLPGCMTHGDTHKAALANVEEAIQLWIDTAKEFGNPIPEAKGRRPVVGPARVMSKGQEQFKGIRAKRRSNPHTTFSAGRAESRMNPKAR
jgi:predicted RNase H-like HicB family nuclease